MAEREHLTHPFGPLYDERSRVLILGSFPSPKSREQAFFYGHPRNRFWSVIAAVLGEDAPSSVEQKRAFCARNRIALWDVLSEVEIAGASDASIKNPVANDLSPILAAAPIEAIFCTGSTSGRYYRKLIEPVLGVPATVLPSTSPANAAMTFERLVDAYQPIADVLLRK
jgi:hypoxanthine-DNA glycosylase